MRFLKLSALLGIFFNDLTLSRAEEEIIDRYTVSPIVSVIVSAENGAHAIDVLQKSVQLSKKVKIGNVLLVTSAEKAAKLSSVFSAETNDVYLMQSSSAERALAQSISALKLAQTEVSVQSPVMKRLRLSYSPTWIVRFEGKDYVFEGYQEISKYFTADGKFTY